MSAVPHPHYPNGFPPAADRSLLGLHRRRDGRHVAIREHEHGYEVFESVCGVCDGCQAADYWRCPTRGFIVTVGGDRPEVVAEYGSMFGVPALEERHAQRLVELEAADRVRNEAAVAAEQAREADGS